MKRWLSEPIVHFLLAGGLLLGVLSLVRSDPPDGRAESPPRRIQVDANALRDFVQIKTGIADPAAFEARYAQLDAAARRHWIDAFVREEALVREARRLGLDEQDDLIRRRLVQQVEFVALGVVENDLEFGPKELERVYRAKREDHRIPETLSFSHVFFGVGANASETAVRAHATSVRDALNADATTVGEALVRGERFLYNRNYVARTREEIESHFGEEMAARLVDLEPDATLWRGPFRSPHGFHLVLLTSREASRVPSAEALRDVLFEDWRREMRDRALDRAVREILSSYQVEIEASLEDVAPR